MSRAHSKRIRQELARAGATRYGLLKSESRYLPKIIHADEHIHGVVYGQYGDSSAMLVATDHRVVFLDVKPMATLMDELSYNIVMGVEFDVHTLFATLMLQTNAADYTVRFANITCAERFARYIEKKRLSASDEDAADKEPPPAPKAAISGRVSDSGLQFLLANELGVLSSVNRDGNVHGAAVYYTVANDFIYVLTRAGTKKAHNILAHNQVGLTVYDEANLKTLHLQGIAEAEPNPSVKKQVYERIVRPRRYAHGAALPPVTKLKREAFIVFRITVINSQFSDYR